MNYWWVNQNQTYETEVRLGFLWSPKLRKNGAKNQFYKNMQDVAVGDLIFSFCDTKIKAIGIATGRAVSSPKPDFGASGANWANEGWYVPVSFTELQSPIRPKDHIELIRPHLPPKYSPLQSSGDGLQSVYLAAVRTPLAHVLIELIGTEYDSVLKNLEAKASDDETIEDQQEAAIKGRTDIGATEIDRLVKARRGQGIFKKNVGYTEKRCRVTGISDLSHLRASHIKPWTTSTDEEKLNGCNGLLLAPHVDHLFDRGFISFSDAGQLLVSPKLDPAVLISWGLSPVANVGQFNPDQSVFLAYHRDVVFQS
ncbi:MAG: HNH endonuclease signature motif containing protein [Sideroxyarcus sp.]|nr:HNH endonuclease signature motif containing protein [Sideroxyarcus sp.]